MFKNVKKTASTFRIVDKVDNRGENIDSSYNGGLNNNIRDFLFKYAEQPDPGYAVMLKGKWGCGKTHFIESWISEYKERYSDNQYVIEPIYVSLFGMTSVDDITEGIDRILHPFLHSKGVEYTKNFLKVVGNIALKTSLDINGDKKDDISFNSTLDTLSLFGSKSDDFSGLKLLVFDDLERCLIDKKALLGYINKYVEHGASHVILIGDETHLTKNDRVVFAKFKEKTVGREFKILPDVNAAVSCFINENHAVNDFFSEQKRLIAEVFNSTRNDNLRILRQCLYDYCSLYNELDPDVTDSGGQFLTGILASFIAVYSEYKGDNFNLLKNWDSSYSFGLTADDGAKESVSEMQQKYISVSEKYKTEILNSSHIKQIVHYIETGNSMKGYVEETVRQMQKGISLEDELAGFYTLESDTLEAKGHELMERIKAGKIENLYQLGRSISILAYFDKIRILELPRDVVDSAMQFVIHKYEGERSKDDLYKSRMAFISGVNSYMQFHDTSIGAEFLESVNTSFEKCDKRLASEIESVLNNLTNDNVSELFKLSESSTPDHHCSYKMTSVFKNCDAERIYRGIKQLNNSNRALFCEFLSSHYMFGYRLGSGCNNFADDLSVLQNIKQSLEKETNGKEGLDAYVLNKVSKYIEGAIRRAEGYDDSIVV